MKSIQLDRDNLTIKKLMRSKIMEKDPRQSHFSRLLEQDGKNPNENKLTEEEIMINVGQAVL